MSSLLRATLIAVTLLTVSGCTSKPVLNTRTDIPPAMQASDAQVKQAILTALEKREWTVPCSARSGTGRLCACVQLQA